MALAISTPIALWNLVTGAGGNDDPTGVSATITPDVDGVIAVGVSCDSATGSNPTIAVSDSVDGTTGWVAGPYRCDSEGSEGAVQLFTKKFTDATPRTITVNVTNMGVISANRDSGRAWAAKITGQDLTTWVGAVAENSTTTTNNWTPAGPTTTRANSIILVAVSEWEALGAMASSDLTETGFHIASVLSGLFGYKSVASAGATTINLDAGSTGNPRTNFVAMEILEASGGGGGSELLPKLVAHGVFIGSAA